MILSHALRTRCDVRPGESSLRTARRRGPLGRVFESPVPVGKINECARLPTGAASTHLPSGGALGSRHPAERRPNRRSLVDTDVEPSSARLPRSTSAISTLRPSAERASGAGPSSHPRSRLSVARRQARASIRRTVSRATHGRWRRHRVSTEFAMPKEGSRVLFRPSIRLGGPNSSVSSSRFSVNHTSSPVGD